MLKGAFFQDFVQFQSLIDLIYDRKVLSSLRRIKKMCCNYVGMWILDYSKQNRVITLVLFMMMVAKLLPGKNQNLTKVLFTDRCRWQNFRSSLLRLVNNCVFTRRKRLGRKFCLLQRSVNSTLGRYVQLHLLTYQLFGSSNYHLGKYYF